MSKYILKILEAAYVTHDVKRFVIEKPDQYTFIPGQSTDVAINLPEWNTKFRSFSFTSLNEWPHLEFTIKIHRDHNGVTNQLEKIHKGAELIIGEPYGSITFKNPGVFIAGGTGITPFIAIFRDLYKKKKIRNNMLIYSNKTSADVVYNDELQHMLDGHFIKTYTRERVIGFIDRRIDRSFLLENIHDFSQQFYVCGPDDFVKNITGLLIDLGVNADTLIF
jgi:ferredoxin-NADP reductase